MIQFYAFAFLVHVQYIIDRVSNQTNLLFLWDMTLWSWNPNKTNVRPSPKLTSFDAGKHGLDILW